MFNKKIINVHPDRFENNPDHKHEAEEWAKKYIIAREQIMDPKGPYFPGGIDRFIEPISPKQPNPEDYSHTSRNQTRESKYIVKQSDYEDNRLLGNGGLWFLRRFDKKPILPKDCGWSFAQSGKKINHLYTKKNGAPEILISELITWLTDRGFDVNR